MADEPNKLQDKPPTIRAALMNMHPKIALAFFLVFVASAMVLLWMIVPPRVGEGGVDAGTIGLIAGMIMLFIKMAADAVGYQFNSSSGSDKKDDTRAAVAGALAEKVPVLTAALATPARIVVAWWSILTPEERAAIEAFTPNPRVLTFIKTAKEGKATPDELAYLVTLGLLTQDRATAIQST